MKNHSNPEGNKPFVVDHSDSTTYVQNDMTRYFANVNVELDYLKNLLIKTVGKILRSGDRNDLCFESVVEGQTIAGGIADVTSDHCIRIDTQQLNEFDEGIAMALIAHELVHDRLQNFKHWKNDIENGQHADNLAREWGFDIDRFRKICGPPRINSRLQ
jgi:hypothetical protein